MKTYLPTPCFCLLFMSNFQISDRETIQKTLDAMQSIEETTKQTISSRLKSEILMSIIPPYFAKQMYNDVFLHCSEHHLNETVFSRLFYKRLSLCFENTEFYLVWECISRYIENMGIDENVHGLIKQTTQDIVAACKNSQSVEKNRTVSRFDYNSKSKSKYQYMVWKTITNGQIELDLNLYRNLARRVFWITAAFYDETVLPKSKWGLNSASFVIVRTFVLLNRKNLFEYMMEMAENSKDVSNIGEITKDIQGNLNKFERITPNHAFITEKIEFFILNEQFDSEFIKRRISEGLQSINIQDLNLANKMITSYLSKRNNEEPSFKTAFIYFFVCLQIFQYEDIALSTEFRNFDPNVIQYGILKRHPTAEFPQADQAELKALITKFATPSPPTSTPTPMPPYEPPPNYAPPPPAAFPTRPPPPPPYDPPPAIPTFFLRPRQPFPPPRVYEPEPYNYAPGDKFNFNDHAPLFVHDSKIPLKYPEDASNQFLVPFFTQTETEGLGYDQDSVISETIMQKFERNKDILNAVKKAASRKYCDFLSYPQPGKYELFIKYQKRLTTTRGLIMKNLILNDTILLPRIEEYKALPRCPKYRGFWKCISFKQTILRPCQLFPTLSDV